MIRETHCLKLQITTGQPACVAACPVGALYFDLKHEVIKEAHRRVHGSFHLGWNDVPLRPYDPGQG